MNKKKKIYFLFLFLLLVVCLLGIRIFNKKQNIDNKEKSNGLVSMLLQDDEGNFVKTERTSWPTEEEGYYFSYSLSYCENGSTLSWEDNKVRLKTAGSDKCYAYFSHTKEEPPIDPGEPSEPSNPIDPNVDKSEVLKKLLADAKEGTLLYHAVISLYGARYGLLNGAGDDSYRYSGKSDDVYNYVCIDNTEVIGDTPTPCANDDLYRIIGLFKNDNIESDDYEQYEMKLIKSDYATTTQLGSGAGSTSKSSNSTYKGELTTIPEYDWAQSGSNNWSRASLNSALNSTFKNYLEQQKPGISQHIEEYKWKVAGNTWSNIGEQTVVTAYKNEIENATGGNGVDANTTYPAQIGLMYVSDYGYAASPDYWTTKLYASNSQDYRLESVRENNWMYMGLDEWTITRNANDWGTAFYVYYDGYVRTYTVYYGYEVRPSFYLKSSTKIASGHGKKDDPYRISW